jgi:hypothetical protein
MQFIFNGREYSTAKGLLFTLSKLSELGELSELGALGESSSLQKTPKLGSQHG